MDQENITIHFKKENSLSVSGNKIILRYNAPLIMNENDDADEITIDLNQFRENISTDSFKNFIDATFGNNLKIESREAYEIQFLCQKYGNNSLLSEINEFIEQIPEPQKEIMKFKLDENEESLKYIANHFPECVRYHEFMDFDPLVISSLVFTSPDFKNHIDSDDYQHFLARYLVKISQDKRESLEENGTLDLIRFEKLSTADINDLIRYYPKIKSKAEEKASSSLKTIHDIIEQGNETLENVKVEFGKMIKEKENTINEIQNSLDFIEQDKERIFSEMNAQRTRIYIVDTQKNNLDIIQKRYDSVKTLYDQVTEYENKIEKCFNDLESKMTNLETTSSEIVNNNSNE